MSLPYNSYADGKAIFELGLPTDFLIRQVDRDNKFVMPAGETIVQGCDTLLVLSAQKSVNEVLTKFNVRKTEAEN